MTRPIELIRAEAEMLVDLCENTSHKRLWYLAEELRAQWGMGKQEMLAGSPRAASITYLGIEAF